jgi:hypothetical protein
LALFIEKREMPMKAFLLHAWVFLKIGPSFIYLYALKKNTKNTQWCFEEVIKNT